MDTRKISSLLSSLPVEARDAAEGLLRQLTHDVQTPLATLAMEIFSFRLLLGKLGPSSSSLSDPDVSKRIASLSEISENMERASTELSDYLSELALPPR
jgi:hypothetical protein